MAEKPDAKAAWMHELRHLYGAGILLFYYAKWPILVGWPVLRFVLEYKDNWIIDLLWVWCLILVIKDFYILVIKKERYCQSRSRTRESEENDGNTAQHESQ